MLYRTNRRNFSDRNLSFISLQLKVRVEQFSTAHRRFSKLVILYRRKKTLRNKMKLLKLIRDYSFNSRSKRRDI